MTSPTLVCGTCNTPLPESAAYCWVCGTPTPTGTTAQGGSSTRSSLQSAQAVIDTRRRLERAMGPQFTVGDLVGRGGFAEVFAVRDQRLKRDLAVKVLSPELVVNQAMLTRFRREAEAVAALRHPGIVPIYDIGESGGIAYIVMPLIKGDTLRKTLEQEDRLSIGEARRILLEVSNALEVAHENGLVHRDIKPENIMLEGPRRQVLVMDFGIAKAIDPDATGVTTAGLIVGTPHYMSPEQASGEQVDARSDQYSLSVMGYRMVTGTHPFEAETTRALLYKQVFEAAPTAAERTSEVPKAFSSALARGMSKEAKDRFPTIAEFSAAIMREEEPVPVAEALPQSAVAEAKVAPTRVARAVKPAKPRAKARPAVTGAAVEAISRQVTAIKRLQPTHKAALAGVVGLATLVVIVVAASGGDPVSPQVPADPSLAQAETTPPPTTTDSAAAGEAAASAVLAGGGGPRRGGSAADPPVSPPPPAPAARAPATSSVSRAPEQRYTTCADAVSASAWTEAAPLCAVEADQGRLVSQLAYAGLLDRGRGVEADPAAAAVWYERAATAGSGEAAFRLGQMYEEGTGVERSQTRAGEFYMQAARRGNVAGMRATAQMLETGNGLPKREQEAVNWYRRAAAGGDLIAMTRLGDLYFDGRLGVSRNEREGARWYARAAEGGNATAQYAIGMAYLNGRGVAASDSVGLGWLARASRQGHPVATQELERRQPPPTPPGGPA